MQPEIRGISVNWWHGYGNKPTLTIEVDHAPKHDEFVYQILQSQKMHMDQLDFEQSRIVGGRSAVAKATHIPVALLEQPPADFMIPKEKFFLLSTNLDPWVKFVYIDNPKGSPTMNGGLSGDYKVLTPDGVTTFKSRSGWSSNAANVNRQYRKWLPNKSTICEVTIKDQSRGISWAGYNLTRDYLWELQKTDMWPKLRNGGKVELVCENDYWTPSAEPFEIVKDVKP